MKPSDHSDPQTPRLATTESGEIKNLYKDTESSVMTAVGTGGINAEEATAGLKLQDRLEAARLPEHALQRAGQPRGGKCWLAACHRAEPLTEAACFRAWLISSLISDKFLLRFSSNVLRGFS